MTDARLRSDAAGVERPRVKRVPASDAAALEGGDETLRTRRDAGPDKADRAMEDRAVTENREVTEDERVEMFRSQFLNGSLPNLPKIPGYHMIWLTTNNPRDSIPMRLRLGYELLRLSDIPGWDIATIKTGEFAGCVCVNEMIAAKLPERLYQLYMNEAHYEAPNREDEKLTSFADSIKEQAQAVGADVIEGDGLRELRVKQPRPQFAD